MLRRASTIGLAVTIVAAIAIAGIKLLADPIGEPVRAGAAGPAECPAGGTTVATGEQLRAALAAAKPGTVIHLADGTYRGGFTLTAKGTAQAQIFVCGSRAAVLDGVDDTDYVLHLNGARWVQVLGFSIRNGRKGVMADGLRDSVLAGLSVSAIGDEAVHLRTHSVDNVVAGLTIRDTGNRKPKFGEGIYVGSATSNWCRYTRCEPDRSDRNSVLDNDIADVTAEGIDIKEGTQGGVAAGNVISGRSLKGADSWIDVKGNGWRVTGNTGSDSPEDGIQVHVVEKGWGARNHIAGNALTVNGPGYGVYIHEKDKGNVVTCDNRVRGAKRGLTNVSCR